ncbi:unnamed protein product [Caenorhabditis nigoni]
MSLELPFSISCLSLAIVGIYLNACFLRSSHRSTVFPRFCCKQIRFLSAMQIVLAASNIVAIGSMLFFRTNRTKKSESFFSTTLSATRAVPQLTVLWTTLERVMFKMGPCLRDNPKFRHTAFYRIFQIFFSTIAEIVIRTAFMNTEEQMEISANNSLIEMSNSEELFIKSTLISNVYFDYYHGIIFIPCLAIAVMMFNSARASHARAGLLGGMRNDSKIQNLSGQMKFFKRSYIPLYFTCLSDFLLQVIIKRGLDLEDSIIDFLYINARCYLPIAYPLALIALNKNLRADYFANIILCRKARNLHKESKVKVIATKESQESIIANLKMIGILSDVDTSQGGPSAAGLAMMGMGPGIGRPTSSIGGIQRVSISKDPTSITSVTSMANTSVTSMGGPSNMMMFHTRPKSSVPSMGSVG